MMTEHWLLVLMGIALIVLVSLWFGIAYSLFYRKKRSRKLREIEVTFAEIVSRHLYPRQDDELSLVEIQRRLRAVGIKPSKKKNVQYLIGLLIRTQGAILGKNYDRLQLLYRQIPPFRASVSKLQKRDWFLKAQGLREIYEMDQEQHLKLILPLRNHPNIYVRREAQIALVVFLGWESLRVLPYLKWNVTLWQQIKIVEKLHDLYTEPKTQYLRNAYDTDNDYARQLIIRIIRKFELREELYYVFKHLDHGNQEVREAAIYCVTSFALNNKELEQLKLVFSQIPDISQQRQLLNYIAENSEIDLDFYQSLLYNSGDLIRLKTAEILWNNGQKELVQEFYYEQYSKTAEHVY